MLAVPPCQWLIWLSTSDACNDDLMSAMNFQEDDYFIFVAPVLGSALVDLCWLIYFWIWLCKWIVLLFHFKIMIALAPHDWCEFVLCNLDEVEFVEFILCHLVKFYSDVQEPHSCSLLKYFYLLCWDTTVSVVLDFCFFLFYLPCCCSFWVRCFFICFI